MINRRLPHRRWVFEGSYSPGNPAVPRSMANHFVAHSFRRFYVLVYGSAPPFIIGNFHPPGNRHGLHAVSRVRIIALVSRDCVRKLRSLIAIGAETPQVITARLDTLTAGCGHQTARRYSNRGPALATAADWTIDCSRFVPVE